MMDVKWKYRRNYTVSLRKWMKVRKLVEKGEMSRAEAFANRSCGFCAETLGVEFRYRVSPDCSKCVLFPEHCGDSPSTYGKFLFKCKDGDRDCALKLTDTMISAIQACAPEVTK